MAFEIDPDLNPKLMPLAWMIGRWQGNGRMNWPGQEEIEFGQQIDFSTNGSDCLHYICQTYTLDDAGAPQTPISTETGFWYPKDDGTLDIALTCSDGYADIWMGKISGAKIELVTDVVMRTQGARVEYTGGQRLYGNVEGDLLWTFDRATTDQPLHNYMWARLARV